MVSIEFEGEIDYLVTHFKFDLAKKQSFSKMNPRKLWTYLWLEDCLDHGKIVEWKFYHDPITIDKDLKPCAGKGKLFLKFKLSSVISTTFEFPAKTKFKILWIWYKIEKFFQNGE